MVLAAKAILRGQLRSRPANGHLAFIPQIRKLVIEYCDMWSSSANTRTYILNHAEDLAHQNPHVEVVVRHRFQRKPIARGFYLNNREKVVPLEGFEVTGIQQKVQLLLDASGSQIKPLKRRTVESTTEAARAGMCPCASEEYVVGTGTRRSHFPPNVTFTLPFPPSDLHVYNTLQQWEGEPRPIELHSPSFLPPTSIVCRCHDPCKQMHLLDNEWFELTLHGSRTMDLLLAMVRQSKKPAQYVHSARLVQRLNNAQPSPTNSLIDSPIVQPAPPLSSCLDEKQSSLASQEDSHQMSPSPPPYSLMNPLQPTQRPFIAPAWYPPEWLHRPLRSPTTNKLSLDQNLRRPSLSRLPSQPLPPLVTAHIRSHSEPINTPQRNVRTKRSSSESSSSSTQSSLKHQPQKSILQRTSSTLTTRTAKSTKSVKFVDIPEIYYDDYGDEYVDEYDDERAPTPDCDTREGEGRQCSGKLKWRHSLKRLISESPLRRLGKQEAPPERRLQISGPYKLSAGSCPTLPFNKRDGDTASIRSFKSVRSSRTTTAPCAKNHKPEMGWMRSKLSILFKGLFVR